MIISDALRELGFSKSVAKVYLSMVKSGKCRASVVMRNTGLQRSVVYSALEELVERELVTKTISKGVAVFSCNNTHSLIDEIERKARLAEKTVEELRNIQGVNNREAIVYEGLDIVQRVANKSLESENGSTVYFLGASKYGIQASLEKFWRQYHKKRSEKGIKCKILYDQDTSQEILNSRNLMPLCDAKYMPFGQDVPMWIAIFEDHVSMMIPGDDPPIAFIIKSQKSADGFRKYFDFLWGQGK